MVQHGTSNLSNRIIDRGTKIEDGEVVVINYALYI
jgi:hypothetical protein